jgi:hypothetical protein
MWNFDKYYQHIGGSAARASATICRPQRAPHWRTRSTAVWQ